MNEKPKTTVALIFGGRGFERDVSLKGAEFVFPLIDRARYNPIPIHVTKVGDWLTDPEVFSGTAVSSAHPARLTLAHFPARQNKKGGIRSEDGRFLPIDLCLPLLHGDHGEDGEIQGTLDTAGIPYVGCGVSAGAIATDKAYTKIIAEHLGITRQGVRDGIVRSEEILRKFEDKLGLAEKFGRLSEDVKNIISSAERIKLINDTNYRNHELDSCIEDVIERARALDI